MILFTFHGVIIIVSFIFIERTFLEIPKNVD